MSHRRMGQTLCALAYLIVLVAVPTSAALLRVYVRQDCLALGYRLSVEQQRRDALRAQLRKAELTRARGRTPAALAAMASRLNLVPPRPGQTLGATWAPGRRSSAPGAATVRSAPPKPIKQSGQAGRSAQPKPPKAASKTPPEPVVPPAAKVVKPRAQPH